MDQLWQKYPPDNLFALKCQPVLPPGSCGERPRPSGKAQNCGFGYFYGDMTVSETVGGKKRFVAGDVNQSGNAAGELENTL